MQTRVQRFDLRCPIEFRYRGPRGPVHGRGVTVNISSRGILLETSIPVPAGARLSAAVSLAAGDAGGATSRLHVQGIAVRCDNGKVAVAVKKHRLRPAT